MQLALPRPACPCNLRVPPSVPRPAARPSQAIKLVHRSLAKTSLQACSALFGDFISSLQYQPIQVSGERDSFSPSNWHALLADLPNVHSLVLDNSAGPAGKYENSLFRALRETKCPVRDVSAAKLTKNARGRLYDLLSDPSYLPLLSPTSQYIQDIKAGKPTWMAKDRLCEIAAKVSRRRGVGLTRQAAPAWDGDGRVKEGLAVTRVAACWSAVVPTVSTRDASCRVQGRGDSSGTASGEG